MEEITNPSTMVTIQRAIDNTPIHFLGVHYKAKLEHAYTTFSDDVYYVVISYGMYALTGMVTFGMPVMQLYLDYGSTMLVVRVTIDMAIQEYREEHIAR